MDTLSMYTWVNLENPSVTCFVHHHGRMFHSDTLHNRPQNSRLNLWPRYPMVSSGRINCIRIVPLCRFYHINVECVNLKATRKSANLWSLMKNDHHVIRSLVCHQLSYRPERERSDWLILWLISLMCVINSRTKPAVQWCIALVNASAIEVHFPFSCLYYEKLVLCCCLYYMSDVLSASCPMGAVA